MDRVIPQANIIIYIYKNKDPKILNLIATLDLRVLGLVATIYPRVLDLDMTVTSGPRALSSS